MFGALGAMTVGLGALPGIAGLGAVIKTASIDSGEYLQDGFEASQDTAIALRPAPKALVKAKFIIPEAVSTKYEWLPLTAAKGIRLVKIRLQDSLSNKSSVGIQCHEVEQDVLASGLPNQTFHCEIQHVSLDDKPVYDAVSYTWLQYKPCIPLIIDGKDILLVNASLYACLQRLVTKEKELVLWWDQICVNQTETAAGLKEKGEQVKLMGTIFAGARKTYIWLGEEDDESKLALETMGKICSLQDSGEEVVDASRQTLQQNAQNLVSPGFRDHTSPTHHQRTAIGTLLNRPWFSRAWIYQEAAVSAHAIVMIGPVELSFSRLSQAVRLYCEAEQEKIRLFDQSLTTATKGYSTLQVIEMGREQRFKHGRWTNAEFLALLCRLAGTVEATNDRDMIYAFNAFQDAETELIGSEYDIPVAEVYEKSTRALIGATRSLDVLGITGGTDRLEGLASWAPDWTQHLPQGHPICRAGHASPFSACGGLIYSPQPVTEMGLLHCRGRILDTVSLVIRHDFNPSDRNKGNLEVFLKLENAIRTLQAAGSPHEQLSEKDKINLSLASDPSSASSNELTLRRLLRVQLADCAFILDPNSSPEITPTQLTASLLTTQLQVYKTDNQIRARDRFLPDLARLVAVRAQMREHMLVCLRRRVFCGQSGRLGLAPRAVEVGDVVAVLEGSRCPVLLRTKGGEVARWRVVGQCYFEGGMEGQMAETEAEGREFVLV